MLQSRDFFHGADLRIRTEAHARSTNDKQINEATNTQPTLLSSECFRIYVYKLGTIIDRPYA